MFNLWPATYKNHLLRKPPIFAMNAKCIFSHPQSHVRIVCALQFNMKERLLYIVRKTKQIHPGLLNLRETLFLTTVRLGNL